MCEGGFPGESGFIVVIMRIPGQIPATGIGKGKKPCLIAASSAKIRNYL
jgi:hypothetical protein